MTERARAAAEEIKCAECSRNWREHEAWNRVSRPPFYHVWTPTITDVAAAVAQAVTERDEATHAHGVAVEAFWQARMSEQAEVIARLRAALEQICNLPVFGPRGQAYEIAWAALRVPGRP